jgi:hypothetical protein
MNTNYLKLISTASILVLASRVALAQTPPEGAGKAKFEDKVTEKVDKWAEQAQKWIEKWRDKGTLGANDVIKEKRTKICAATQEKVGVRWQKYYDARMNRVENMAKGVVTLQKRIEFFKTKGLSTTELETDIGTLEKLIGEYKTAYATFLAALEKAKNLPCANYQGEFLPKLKEAKTEWAKVGLAAQVIKDFYGSDIKPDLQALRVQLDEKITETED